MDRKNEVAFEIDEFFGHIELLDLTGIENFLLKGAAAQHGHIDLRMIAKDGLEIMGIDSSDLTQEFVTHLFAPNVVDGVKTVTDFIIESETVKVDSEAPPEISWADN